VIADARTVIGYALAESIRKRVLLVVLVLTAAFLTLYAIGVHFAFESIDESFLSGQALVDEQALVGGTIFGLAMFAVLFLGSVLAIFLTNGLVRGDAESGLLQPLVVRPIRRGTMLVARFLGAVTATTIYVAAVFLAAAAITVAAGDWTPNHLLEAGFSLVLAVAVVAALSVLASVFLAASAQGIAVFMIFGAGLVGGLLGQIGEGLDSSSLRDIGSLVSKALPFEALYQGALHLIATDATGLTRVVIQLGPFGGAEQAGLALVAFALAYVAATLALAAWAFGRRDL
jgi:Cu-processing system permease protein